MQKACAQARIFVNCAKSLCSGSGFCELSKKLVLRLGFFLAEQKACTQARGGNPGLSISALDVFEFLRFG